MNDRPQVELPQLRKVMVRRQGEHVAKPQASRPRGYQDHWQVYQILPTQMKRGGTVLSFPPTAECLDRPYHAFACLGRELLLWITGFPKTNDQHHVQVRARQLFKRPQRYYSLVSPTRSSHNSHNLAIRSLLIAQQLRRRDNNIHQLHQLHL
jgi:hypothetical protein